MVLVVASLLGEPDGDLAGVPDPVLSASITVSLTLSGITSLPCVTVASGLPVPDPSGVDLGATIAAGGELLVPDPAGVDLVIALAAGGELLVPDPAGVDLVATMAAGGELLVPDPAGVDLVIAVGVGRDLTGDVALGTGFVSV